MDNEVPAMEDNNIFHIDSVFNTKHDDSSIRLPVDVGDVNEAIVFITMSSGTTGKPKAIPSKYCIYLFLFTSLCQSFKMQI